MNFIKYNININKLISSINKIKILTAFPCTMKKIYSSIDSFPMLQLTK